MKNIFRLTFDTMPKGTAQQKRYNGRTHTYFKSKSLRDTEFIFFESLYPYAPEKPSKLPVVVCLSFYFDVKDKKKWGLPKTTVPDLDNYCKTFLDQMVKCGFFEDDAQIVELHLSKFWSEKASIAVYWKEAKDDE